MLKMYFKKKPNVNMLQAIRKRNTIGNTEQSIKKLRFDDQFPMILKSKKEL